MSGNTLTITSWCNKRVITLAEANGTELASNMLYMRSKDDIWKEIGDCAYNLCYSSATVDVTEEILNEFPLKDWKEYS
jgi:hypothetical protein